MNSSAGQQIPDDIVFPQSALLEMPLSELDHEKSFIAINWVYLMNITQKIINSKHPNILAYYKFDQDRFKVIGLQCDSFSGVQLSVKDLKTGILDW